MDCNIVSISVILISFLNLYLISSRAFSYVLFHMKIEGKAELCRFAFIAKQRPAEAVKEAVTILGDVDWLEAND